MKYIMALFWAFCLLLSGCATEAALPEHPVAGVKLELPADEPQSELLVATSYHSEANASTQGDKSAVIQMANRADEGQGTIAKTLSGGEIEQIEVYAELCTLVLEKYEGDDIQVIFSYPELAASNYRDHFALQVTEKEHVAYISTDYENQRWDTAFATIDGFDGNQYRKSAVLTVKLPQKQYKGISLHLVTPGETLKITGVDTSVLDIQISTGDVVVETDRAYQNLSLAHKVGNVTLRMPGLGKQVNVTSKIGVFTLSLPAEPTDVNLEIQYDEDAIAAGDEAIYILPLSWEPAVSGHTVRYSNGSKGNGIAVKNQRYGVFALQVDGLETGEPMPAIQ